MAARITWTLSGLKERSKNVDAETVIGELDALPTISQYGSKSLLDVKPLYELAVFMRGANGELVDSLCYLINNRNDLLDSDLHAILTYLNIYLPFEIQRIDKAGGFADAGWDDTTKVSIQIPDPPIKLVSHVRMRYHNHHGRIAEATVMRVKWAKNAG